MDELEYRMYSLVPYHLSGIQKGIQTCHAITEYELLLGHTLEYSQWALRDKTLIVLNGGTTGVLGGDLDKTKLELESYNIPHAIALEPDLNNTLTSIVFLADNRVWDFNSYPTFNNFLKGGYQLYVYGFNTYISDVSENNFPQEYEKWLTMIGGKKNEVLKSIIYGRHLA